MVELPPLPQAGEGWGEGGVAGRVMSGLAFTPPHPHPQPFSRLREKGARHLLLHHRDQLHRTTLRHQRDHFFLQIA